MTTTTFNMSKVNEKTQKGGATFKQCRGLGFRLAKRQPNGKPDWQDASRIKAHLLKLAGDGKFTFMDASTLYNEPQGRLPAKYRRAITKYVKDHNLD